MIILFIHIHCWFHNFIADTAVCKIPHVKWPNLNYSCLTRVKRFCRNFWDALYMVTPKTILVYNTTNTFHLWFIIIIISCKLLISHVTLIRYLMWYDQTYVTLVSAGWAGCLNVGIIKNKHSRGCQIYTWKVCAMNDFYIFHFYCYYNCRTWNHFSSCINLPLINVFFSCRMVKPLYTLLADSTTYQSKKV